MPVEIEAFLVAYKPKFICLACLSQVTAREPTDVKTIVGALLATRRAESQAAECLNCNDMAFVGAAVERPQSAARARDGRRLFAPSTAVGWVSTRSNTRGCDASTPGRGASSAGCL
jgi:hypothetical protein